MLICINLDDILYDAGLDELPEAPEPEYDVDVEISVSQGYAGSYYQPPEPAEAEPELNADDIAMMALVEYERQIGFKLEEDSKKRFFYQAEAHAAMALDEACDRALMLANEEPDAPEYDD